MNIETVTIALISLVSWGLGSFVAKLATNRIGDKAVFWDLIGYFIGIVGYIFFTYKNKAFFSMDKLGISLAFLAGFIGSFGAIYFYILLTKKDASAAVPLTALYPALTALLAFIFLKESLTLPRITGIILAIAAVYLLSL